MDTLYKEIREYLDTLKIIDTHEHLTPFAMMHNENADVLSEFLSHYFSSDLLSAGLSESDLGKIRDIKIPISERWDKVEPYWKAAENTGYGRALKLSAKYIYGIDEINKTTIESLNERFLKAMKDKNHLKFVLKDLCNLETSLLDYWNDNLDINREYFAPVWHPDRFIQAYGKPTVSFDDFCSECELKILQMRSEGMAALKCALAYSRSLFFEKTSYSTAKECYDATSKDWKGFPKQLQDFMMHHVLSVANTHKIPIQIHTGLQEGQRNDVRNSDPSLLNNLFAEYPDVNFDLFHIGYPYEKIISVLSKTNSNVYIDMCWSHIISPYAARNALSDFLDAVPSSKIFAFGGDYLFVDGIYGHLHIAKDNVAAVLTQKVKEGAFGIDLALSIAKTIFYENPKKVLLNC